MKEWPLKVSKLSKAEIREATRDSHWQEFRLGMKAYNTEGKLDCLEIYHTNGRVFDKTNHERRMRRVRIDNYINALLRGGQLKRVAPNRIVVQR